jgi:uncharacterized protein (TIGR01777 family)
MPSKQESTFSATRNAKAAETQDTTLLHVAITGASGFVGSRLCSALGSGQYRVRRLVRRNAWSRGDELCWFSERGHVDASAFEGLDAVVHLAGENISSGRWTSRRKASIRSSRVQGTRLLSDALASQASPPRVLVTASAIGFYGDRGAEILTEESARGGGFLAEVCSAWESAALPAIDAGIRVVNLRFGIVLGAGGGALGKMLPFFRRGLGGRLGDGAQYMSWITLDDVVGVIAYVLADESLSGPVNAVAPEPATNREFTRTLAEVLGRPAVLPVPAGVLRLVLGQMADELLLSSTRALPMKLEQSGFAFADRSLRQGLRNVLA